jgi:hypothetical protein
MPTWQTPVFEYEPASHSTQSDGVTDPRVADAFPASQTVQLDSALAPVPSRYFPTAHGVHDSDFVLFENVPALQGIQETADTRGL